VGGIAFGVPLGGVGDGDGGARPGRGGVGVMDAAAVGAAPMSVQEAVDAAGLVGDEPRRHSDACADWGALPVGLVHRSHRLGVGGALDGGGGLIGRACRRSINYCKQLRSIA
jgi:hypothetical protein